MPFLNRWMQPIRAASRVLFRRPVSLLTPPRAVRASAEAPLKRRTDGPTNDALDSKHAFERSEQPLGAPVLEASAGILLAGDVPVAEDRRVGAEPEPAAIASFDGTLQPTDEIPGTPGVDANAGTAPSREPVAGPEGTQPSAALPMLSEANAPVASTSDASAPARHGLTLDTGLDHKLELVLPDLSAQLDLAGMAERAMQFPTLGLEGFGALTPGLPRPGTDAATLPGRFEEGSFANHAGQRQYKLYVPASGAHAAALAH